MPIPIKDFLDSDSNAVLIKTNFKIDIESIVDFFETEVKKFPKIIQFPDTFRGGWSIQSNTGDIYDGWQIAGPAGVVVKHQDFKLSKKFENSIKNTFPDTHTDKFLTPTNLYQGPVKKFIEDLELLNFKARRTRFVDLDPKSTTKWHIDNGFKETWRGHIAVVTNDKSLFQWKADNDIIGDNNIFGFNIPADGHLYLARIDKLHRVINQGDDIRTHIILDNDRPLKLFNATVEPVLEINQE